MPVIVAKHNGTCSTCQQGIVVGESIDYSREIGARHLACTDVAPVPRTNQFRARCAWCAAWVKKGAGVLKVVETETDPGSYVRRNEVRCADTRACGARCAESIVRGLPHRRR